MTVMLCPKNMLISNSICSGMAGDEDHSNHLNPRQSHSPKCEDTEGNFEVCSTPDCWNP